MNLLVTNTRNPQAYAIIRALRPYAQKVVATMYGDSRLAARLSPAANSRLVDARYHVPSPVDDWRAGNVSTEPTEKEEAFIQAVLEICEKEQIDTIFPSWDPQVYLLSKNRERFEQRGITIPVPDLETVFNLLDKYRTVQAAEEVGFPCPRTFLPESEEEAEDIAQRLGFPVIIKPRFTAGGRGTARIQDLPELRRQLRVVKAMRGMPMVQDYIPGGELRNSYVVMDKEGELKTGFCNRKRRHILRLQLQFSIAQESLAPQEYLGQASALVQKLGWWGGATIQTKLDPRDGIPKLMEVSPEASRSKRPMSTRTRWFCSSRSRMRSGSASSYSIFWCTDSAWGCSAGLRSIRLTPRSG
jgi:carbamoylphosphate synthase large subunit